jgi:hypothetical protein
MIVELERGTMVHQHGMLAEQSHRFQRCDYTPMAFRTFH